MDLVRTEYIKEWISQLPSGNITYKKINGKKYPYYQWSENGKQRSRIVKSEEFEELSDKIAKRKELEKKLKESNISENQINEERFFSTVMRGTELVDYVSEVKKYRKRECYQELYNYVYGNTADRVFILYGLRRTGKTTMIRQIISEMSPETLLKTAFIQIDKSIDLAKINIDLKRLLKLGYKYVFIDEVTLMDDFIESAALFSDVYAASGMKIVLSGTDSLGFLFSEDRELYDRCFMLHTTFISYREFSNVLGIDGIDNYIKYGGTMSLGGIDYNNKGMTFATQKSTSEYVDSAIASNIQHSLKNYQNGGHFRNLAQLYEADELTSAINRIIEDMNHRFTLEILTKEFKSSDLSISAKNLLKDREEPNDVLYRIDREAVTERFREMLEIKNKPEQTVEISDAHRTEIREYLDMLDLTVNIKIVNMTDFSKKENRVAFSQPGMRYSQAEALIKALLDDDVFRMLNLNERNIVKERILSDVKGRMLEDIVLLETQAAHKDCEVFKLMFATGEFDMVVFNPNTASCSVYEIKYSDKVDANQYRHLIDSEKCAQTEHRYGKIEGKYVIYRGETQMIDEIQYINVEEFLKRV